MANSVSGWLPSWVWTQPLGNRETLLVEEFEDLEELRLVEIVQGCTVRGKKVVLIVGNRLVVYPGFDHERLYRYIEQCLESIAGHPYVILYVHTNVTYSENCPGVYWLRNLYYRLPPLVKERLSSLLVLHCDLSLWGSMSLCCPRDIWGKVEWVSRVEFLKEMLQGPLELPKFVHDHDRLLEEQPLADYMIYSTKEAIAHGTGIGGQQTMY